MTDALGDTPHCLNCGAALGGQYCGQCGQRATSRLISLWELLSDAFGDLLELDSRLWRTVIPLLVRPGVLTRDYLEGRRARYMPPFRMYLVLSLIFFVIAFFDPREQLAIFYTPAELSEPEQTSDEIAEQRQEARAALEKLASNGVIDESVLGPNGLPAAGNIESDEMANADSVDDGTIEPDDCELQLLSDESAPEFIRRRFSEERLRQVCERVVEAGAGGVSAAVIDNTPAALIILLPLMALALKLIYPLSRRYYVEHLLFFVHFHAFMFLLLSLQIMWSRLVVAISLPGWVSVLPIVATSFYIPVYLYKSMRRVYGQGHAFTTLKFLTLSVTYVLGFSLMMLGALLIAVFSI